MSSPKVSSGWLAESAHILGYTLPETNIKFAIGNGWLEGRGFSFQGRCWLRVLKNKPVKLHHFRLVPNSGAKTGLVQLLVMRNGVLGFGLASDVTSFSFCGHTREITQAMDLCVSYELDIQVSRIM